MDLGGLDGLSGYSQLQATVACAICGFKAGIETSYERLEVVGIGTVRIGYGYCSQCGHIYQVLPPPPEKLALYYEKFGNYTLNFEPDEITKRLWNMSGQFQSIYEVGCGTGRHLAKFRERGQTVGGCEPSPRCVESAKERFGIDLDLGTEAECLPG